MAKKLPKSRNVKHKSISKAQKERLLDVFESKSLAVKGFLASIEPKPL